jgi:uncharacterized cupin superfamily protein
MMQIEDEAEFVKPGDMIKIPRNARHTIWPTGDGELRALCFATSFQEPGRRFTVCDLPAVQPLEQVNVCKDHPDPPSASARPRN